VTLRVDLGRFMFLGGIASPLNPRLFVAPIFSIARLRKFEVYMLLFFGHI